MTIKMAKGMPVVSLADGATLGTIDHVYFDPQQLAVVGFTFHQRGGLFGSGGDTGLVDISDVHAFGADAVTVKDVAVVRSGLAVEMGHDGLIDLEDLLKRNVMTESGEAAGRVAAIQFGDASHALVALDIAGDGATTRVDARLIKTVGADMIIIADPVRAEAVPPRGIVREITATHAMPEADRRQNLKVVGA